MGVILQIQNKEKLPGGLEVVLRSDPEEALLSFSAALFCRISSNCKPHHQQKKKRSNFYQVGMNQFV